MMRPLVAIAALALLPALHATAQPLALPPPPAAKVEQRIGAQLPLDLRLADSAGRAARLGDFFKGGRPVLLVLGYYRCPQLCGLLMHGLLEGLQASGLPRRQWRIVGVSIDPQDTPAAARSREELDRAYADFLLGSRQPEGALDLHLLVASAADSQRLAHRVGFRFTATGAPEPARGAGLAARFAHPTAVMVATPDGKISRYLMGIGFDPDELRSALAQARGGAIGALTERISLLCAHFDPTVGRHSGAVMNGMRLLGLATVAALAAWGWRRRGSGRGAAP